MHKEDNAGARMTAVLFFFSQCMCDSVLPFSCSPASLYDSKHRMDIFLFNT